MTRAPEPLAQAAEISAPRTTQIHAAAYRRANAKKMTTTTASAVATPTLRAARGAAIAPHSRDSRAPAPLTRMRNGARQMGAGHSNTHTDARAAAARTRPDTTLTPKLVQSKRLARGKDVIDRDPPVAPLSRVIIGD